MLTSRNDRLIPQNLDDLSVKIVAPFARFFHPDHPDASRKIISYSPTLPDEIMSDLTKMQGMPTSCNDLQLLGHKLNGLYLVKTSQPNQGTKIETIFCNFHQTKIYI